MKKFFISLAAFALVAVMLIGMSSCAKVKKTVLGWLGQAKETAESIDKDKDGAAGQGVFAVEDGSKNRESRIEGAIAKARNSQMEYNKNRTLDGGLDAQPDGTVYVVEANGFYISFIVEGGELVDNNPEVLPTEDPYANNKDYKKAKKYIDNIRKDTTIYLPKGAN